MLRFATKLKILTKSKKLPQIYNIISTKIWEVVQDKPCVRVYFWPLGVVFGNLEIDFGSLGFDSKPLGGYFGHLGIAFGPLGADFLPLGVEFWASESSFLTSGNGFWSLRVYFDNFRPLGVDFRHRELISGLWKSMLDIWESILGGAVAFYDVNFGLCG